MKNATNKGIKQIGYYDRTTYTYSIGKGKIPVDSWKLWNAIVPFPTADWILAIHNTMKCNQFLFRSDIVEKHNFRKNSR